MGLEADAPSTQSPPSVCHEQRSTASGSLKRQVERRHDRRPPPPQKIRGPVWRGKTRGTHRDGAAADASRSGDRPPPCLCCCLRRPWCQEKKPTFCLMVDVSSSLGCTARSSMTGSSLEPRSLWRRVIDNGGGFLKSILFDMLASVAIGRRIGHVC